MSRDIRYPMRPAGSSENNLTTQSRTVQLNELHAGRA